MHPRSDSLFPLHLLTTSLLWTSVLGLAPASIAVQLLGFLHGVIVTVTSILCIRRGDDTAFSCAASVSFFAVDAGYMLIKDGLLPGTTNDKGERGRFGKLRQARKMDYVHHVLGVTFGTLQHYFERDLCPPHVGNAFVWVQWNKISTPFYNLYRITKSPVLGGLFALTFFLSRVVGNTVVVIPLLYGQCGAGVVGKIHGLLTAPYFLLQYIWFYMIVKKMLKTSKKEKKGEGKGEEADPMPPTTVDKKTD